MLWLAVAVSGAASESKSVSSCFLFGSRVLWSASSERRSAVVSERRTSRSMLCRITIREVLSICNPSTSEGRGCSKADVGANGFCQMKGRLVRARRPCASYTLCMAFGSTCYIKSHLACDLACTTCQCGQSPKVSHDAHDRSKLL